MSEKARPAFRLESRDLCWPLLFHLEPLLTAHDLGEYSVTVIDDQGSREFPDVASARTGAQQHPPHRVELFVREGSVKLAGLWMVGFGPGQEPAISVSEQPGTGSQANELRASIAEFLDEDDPAVAPATALATSPTSVGRWRLIANQPWTVQVVGGVIATLLASAVVALITVLLR